MSGEEHKLDKRRCWRMKINLPASFQVYERQRHISIGTTLNVSAIGICLETREKIEVGQEFPIKIALPLGEKLIIKVKARWVKEKFAYKGHEYTVGLKILEPMTADASRFVKFCAQEMLLLWREGGPLDKESH